MLNSFLIIFENEFRKHGGDAICKREKVGDRSIQRYVLHNMFSLRSSSDSMRIKLKESFGSQSFATG